MTFADHSVTFPVPEAPFGIDDGRTLINRDLIGNNATPTASAVPGLDEATTAAEGAAVGAARVEEIKSMSYDTPQAFTLIVGLCGISLALTAIGYWASDPAYNFGGIAVALVNDPEVVFLDEPTTGLDPQARREVWRVIADLKNKGKTVFLTTHYMEEAEELADHIAIIHRGKIIAEGSVDELIEKYGSGLCLTFKEVDSNSIKTLKGLGCDIKEAKNHDVSISIKDKDELIDLLSDLQKRKLKYKEFNVRRSNLEEVFLKLTGEALRGGNSA